MDALMLKRIFVELMAGIFYNRLCKTGERVSVGLSIAVGLRHRFVYPRRCLPNC